MSQYTSYWLFQRYEKRGDQDWIPVYPNVYSVDGEGSLTAVTKTDNDPACGYVPTGETIYRWVNMNPHVDYYCEECPPDPSTRIYRWTKTTNTICVEDEPTPTGGTKWVAAFTGGTTASAACDASSAITSGEVSSDVASIEIGDCVTSIGNNAFINCTSLTSITIPNSVTSIGNNAFNSCLSLSSVTIPNSVASIGGDAFWGCNHLTSITVEATTPPTLGSLAFDDTNDCPIYVPCSAVSAYRSASGWSDYASRIHGIPPCEEPPKWVATFAGGTTASAECDASSAITNGEVSSDVVSIEIGDCVTSINNSAFYGCTSLSSVTISYSVTSIGESAFRFCSSLSGITIPDSVTSIGFSAFTNCYSLTSVTIGNGVTSIGRRVFYQCTGLTSVTIPSVTSIGASAFTNCYSLTTGTIPSCVTSIGDSAFMNCSGLTSVTIPSGATSIGANAFAICSSLSNVTVEATTPPTLGSLAFNGTNNCPIYVPSASVQVYKQTGGWRTYASRIQAIP